MESGSFSVVVVVVPCRLVGEKLSVWLDVGTDNTARLPTRSLGSDEGEDEALVTLIAAMPFAREVLRRVSFGVFARPGRVHGKREVALASWAIVRAGTLRGSEILPATGAWHPIDELPVLDDDHAEIISAARLALAREIVHDPVTQRLVPRHLLRATSDGFGPSSDAPNRVPVLFGFLPDPFPLSAIRRFYERLLGAPIDRGNFRRKLVELKPTGIVKELPIFQRGVRHRAAQLFTFDTRAWERWAGGDE